MTTLLESLAQGRQFDEFQYRLLYLKPTPYSDERIAVGLVADSQNRLEARFVSSVATIELMTRIFGEHGVEQFQFAAGEVRRALLTSSSLDSLSMPTDLFVAGDTLAAFTPDRNGLLTSILASASCLVRSGESKSIDALSAAPTQLFSEELFDHVSRLSPLTANRIFNQRVTVDTGEVVDLPIVGRRIFGAPVSFATRDQRMRTEAYVAKFHWLRTHLSQLPRVYLLAPQEGDRAIAGHFDPSIRELRAIAAASNVPLKVSESTEEMASLILQDEAA